MKLIKTKWVVLLVALLFAVFFSMSFLLEFPIMSNFKKSTIYAKNAVLVGLPVRFKIPSINVDAAVDYVGLTTGGAVGVPKGPDSVAWFNGSPRPGEKGNSIIDGHFGWKDNIPAVFDNLDKLKKGDKIYVEDEKGTIITFVVREIRLYGEHEDASSVFNPEDDAAHLNLITCEGVWSVSQKSYSNRLVVFSDKE